MQAQDLGQSGRRLIRGAMVFSICLSQQLDIAFLGKRLWKTFQKTIMFPRHATKTKWLDRDGSVDMRQITLSGLGSSYRWHRIIHVHVSADKQSSQRSREQKSNSLRKAEFVILVAESILTARADMPLQINHLVRSWHANDL